MRSGYVVKNGHVERTALPSLDTLNFVTSRADTLAQKNGIGFIGMDIVCHRLVELPDKTSRTSGHNGCT